MRLTSTRTRRARTMLVLAVLGLALTATEAAATVAPTGAMAVGRYDAAIAPVVDGGGTVTGVLVVGGVDSTNGVLGSAEFYDAATRTWSAAGNLSDARAGAHAVTLPVTAARPQGGVLVEGGVTVAGGGAGNSVATTEVYDRATNTWSSGGSLTTARFGEALTRVGNRVLVAGGVSQNGSVLASAERWNDTARPAWTTAGSMGTFRRNLAATEISGGRALITGGNDSKGDQLASTELYDSASNTWAAGAPMAVARAQHTATAVSGGEQVLAAGGNGTTGLLNSSELYTVASNTWAGAGTLGAPRSGQTAVAIDAGLVELVGGTDPRDGTTSAESWTPAGGWAGPTGPGTVEPLDQDRQSLAAARLGPTAGVLVTGGYGASTLATTSSAVTLFPTRPAPTPTPAPTTVAAATPAPLLTSTPAPTPTPRVLVPVQGRTLVAAPASGVVLIRIGPGRYRPLKTGEAIPVGAYLDATNGHVTITGAVGGVLQTAQFWGGVFQVTQPTGERGQIDIRIVGSPVCAKPKATVRRATRAGAAVVAGAARAKAKKKKAPPRVWGDGHGNFSTRGANSAATVRGTRWLVEERCTGTFTRVARGVVSVRDFARNRTFLLPAPRTYLARPKATK